MFDPRRLAPVNRVPVASAEAVTRDDSCPRDMEHTDPVGDGVDVRRERASPRIMQKELRGNGQGGVRRSCARSVQAVQRVLATLIRSDLITHRYVEVRQGLPRVQRSDALPLFATLSAKTRNDSVVTN